MKLGPCVLAGKGQSQSGGLLNSFALQKKNILYSNSNKLVIFGMEKSSNSKQILHTKNSFLHPTLQREDTFFRDLSFSNICFIKHGFISSSFTAYILFSSVMENIIPIHNTHLFNIPTIILVTLLTLCYDTFSKTIYTHKQNL